ncbi:MAG: hypothetical protein ACREJP_06550 [Candidatus Methylomirabilales bacterium]
MGTQHVIEEEDLESMMERPAPLSVPEEWRSFEDGTPQPNWVAMLYRSRRRQ